MKQARRVIPFSGLKEQSTSRLYDLKKLLNLSVSLFPQLWHEDNSTYLIRLL